MIGNPTRRLCWQNRHRPSVLAESKQLRFVADIWHCGIDGICSNFAEGPPVSLSRRPDRGELADKAVLMEQQQVVPFQGTDLLTAFSQIEP